MQACPDCAMARAPLRPHAGRAWLPRHRSRPQHARSSSSSGSISSSFPADGGQQLGPGLPSQQQQLQQLDPLPPKLAPPPLQPECQQLPRAPPLLAWLPPGALLQLQALGSFLRACWELRPEFVAPTFPQALQRLALVLGASLVMIIVVCTIDSGWLHLYLLNARRVPLAAA